MGDEAPAVIIDNGSGYIKVGLGGQDQPSHTVPTIVGTPKYEKTYSQREEGAGEMLVGEDAISKRGILHLTNPIEHGMVVDWDGMKKLWDNCYNDCLRLSPSDQPVILTEAPMNSQKNREKMAQMFFEEYNVPAYYVCIQAVLSLLAGGRTDGIVMDSGDGVTHFVPIYDGFSIKHATRRINIAGRDLTAHMVDLLQESNVRLTDTAEFDVVRAMKEAKCYVALDFKAEKEAFMADKDKTKEVSYELPDGTMVSFGDQQFRCPEVLFQPTIIGRDVSGVHAAIVEQVKKCDIDIRKKMYENIILSGGCTMFPGIAERLTKEVKELCAATINVNVIAPPERKLSVWMGASNLSTMSSFGTMWVTAEEYEEMGTNAILRKCY